ncbi:hypothetical protein LC574_23715 [Nostoc sp. CHAB 5715]|nr:hypothetical protein [Nostoc sp. CHAB 5715]
MGNWALVINSCLSLPHSLTPSSPSSPTTPHSALSTFKSVCCNFLYA